MNPESAAGERAAGSDGLLLSMRGIVKVFPGVRALDGVDFTLRRGEVQALMGENGAGKSTLLKVLTGVHRADAGRIELEARAIDPRTPPEAQALGIASVHQEVNLIPFLSVAENICLGRQPMKPGRIDWKATNRKAREALQRLEMDIDVAQPLAACPIAIRQLVAIARALSFDAKALVLDEPTSSLDDREVERLFGVVRRLKSEGMGIVFVTHFLDQAYEISDRFTILRNGKLIGEYETPSLSRIELVSKMIGRDASDLDAAAPAGKTGDSKGDAPPLLRAKNISGKGVKGAELEIRPGETLGFAGLLGSGRTETANLLFGVDLVEGGALEIDGKPAAFKSPRDAIKAGIGMCPEDRRSAGISPNLSVRENIVLALQASTGWLRPLSQKRQLEIANQFVKALNIATPDVEKPIAQLSGGNQQKAILARWLASGPRLLILDEPTRGVDVGAKAEIEKQVQKLRAEGIAIILISSELEEVVRGSGRVAVFRDGEKIGELEGEQIALPPIMRMIAGEKEKEKQS